jgi:hypothetical protein
MMIRLINWQKSMNNKMQSEVEIMHKQAPQKTALSGLFGALAFMSCSVAMAGSLSVTNTFTAGNAANAADVNLNFDDVEAAVNDNNTRITALEGGGGGANRMTVAVDCDADANALLSAPISGNFTANTTYEITGPCNGPIEVNADGVWFVGQVGTSAAIVLPGGTPSSSAAVFGNGAHDLRLDNLLIDVSALTDSDGVWARNAFVRIIDTDVTGGAIGINPFRSAIVRLEGTVNVTGFAGGGIEVGEKSVLSARGPVTVSTTITDGGGMTGVSAYKSGLAEFRAGLIVTVPAENEGTDFYPSAMSISGNSYIRVRSSGTNVITGKIHVSNNSLLEINGTNQSAGGILAFMNSTVIINDSSVGPVQAVAESAVQFGYGTISVADNGDTSIECELASSIAVGDLNGYPDFSTTGGVELWENCYLGFFNGTINGNVYVSDNSTLTMEADSVEGTSATIIGDFVVSASSAALLEGDTVSIDGNVLVQRSSHVSLDSANGPTVTGDFQVRTGSGMSVQNSVAGIIVGTLECDTTTGTYLDIPHELKVASAYLVDFSIMPGPDPDNYYCGFIFPSPW